MNKVIGYRARLMVRIGKSLSTDETTLHTKYDGRPVTVKSAKQNQPLKEASWLVLGASGFATEHQAREFGKSLRRAVHLAGLCTRVGTDGRSSGDDQTTTYVSPAGEQWLRSLGRLGPGQRILPNVHGLTVFPDNESVRIASGNASGRVTHNPKRFIRAIEEAAVEGISQDVQRAIGVLNLAQINESPLAKVVLAVSSIEALAHEDTGWTAAQKQMIDKATDWVRRKFSDNDDTGDVTGAIQRMHQQSLRQQAKRLFDRHQLPAALWKEWEVVYKHRSRLFHGGANREDPNVVKLANDAITVCGTIVLSIAKQRGAVLPTAATVHFGVSQ